VHPRRERLSIWKLSEDSEHDGAVGPEAFLELYNNRGKSGFQKTAGKPSLSHILATEEKEEQGTVMVMNCKVTIEGALSIHKQDEFEEKKVHVTGDQIPADYLSKIGLAVTCKKGLKPESPNQDDYSILIDGNTILLGVFDGHGPYGHNVSNYIHTLLPKLISQNGLLATEPQNVFTLSFDKCQKALEMHCEHPQTNFDCIISGSTASVVLIKDDKLYSAHVGDSRAVLSRLLADGKREAIVLTPDHKPTLPEEKARIESCNGEVKKLPNDIPYRVFIRGRDFPGLAMSRSIGDLLSRDLGIVSEPTISERVVSEEDEFVLMCSDGVWEFISNEEAVELVGSLGRQSVAEAAEQLAKKAWTRWIHQEGDVVDDITVMISYLPKGKEVSVSSMANQSNPTQL
jgi:serine/threonine protein phosphatase PrpC